MEIIITKDMAFYGAVFCFLVWVVYEMTGGIFKK